MKDIAFITGASSGIGRSLALVMAKDYSVAIVARRQAELDELTGEIRNTGGVALPIACDVTDRTLVHRAVERCEKELGPIQCVVLNAGVGGANPAVSFDAEAAERVLRTNLLGPVYCLEAVIPGMVQRKSGQIVGISSLASFRGLPDSGPYCASKSGLNALLESLRISLRSHQITVTTINPGFIRTPMTARNRNPMPFLMEQDEAARLIYDAIRAKKSTYSFPWQLALITKIARFLPDSIYDRIFAAAKVRKEPVTPTS